MKSMKKIFSGLFALVLGVSAGAAVAGLNKVDAKEAAASEASFELVGASVRTGAPDGIRFIAQVDTDALVGYGENAKYGVMMIPQNMDSGTLTVSYDGLSYTASNPNAVVIEGGEFWSEDLRAQYGIADGYSAYASALLADQGNGDEVVSFPTEFYNRPITAVGFIIPERGSTIYTSKVTRSIGYVATVESLKADYETSVAVDKFAAGAQKTLSVNGGKVIDKFGTHTPVLTIGGMDAMMSNLVTVAYSSSNQSVAKIVDGKVQAVGEGTATITATIKAGGTVTTTATTKITVDLAEYTISATAGEGGSVTGAGTYKHGDSVTLTATASKNYTFDGWYEGNTKVSGNATYTFTAGANKSLTAKFTPQQYLIETTQNFKAGGTVTASAEYAYNTNATLKATPNTDYVFLGWYKGATKVSDNATYTVKVTGDAKYEAKFSAKIGLNSGLFQHANLTSTTILSDKSITITNGVDIEYVGTVATDYTNFVLEYDLTDFKGTTTWLGVAFAGTNAATHYASNPLIYALADTINALNCTLEGTNVGGGRVWYTPVGDVPQGPWQATGAVHMKLQVKDGVASLTTSFKTSALGDVSVTASTAKFASTKGRVYIPLPGANCTISNLTLIDLDGRDFNGSTVGDVDVEAVTSSMKDLKAANQVKIDGRTHFDNNNALVLRNSAAGFEVYTTSSKLTMNYSVSSVSPENYLKVWVDGTESVLKLTSTTATDVVLADNLQAGVRHHIKVAKMNEVYAAVRDQLGAEYCNNIKVHSLTCLSNGVIEQAPAASNLKIEVYGDSITCGYGALDTSDNLWYATDKEDATVTYAYKTAQALGADINVIAHQGWGIMKTNQNSIWSEANLALNFSISGCVEPGIAALWNGSVYDISYLPVSDEVEDTITHEGIWQKTTDVEDASMNPDWDFSSYTPDIVIIALGTNDFVNYRTDATIRARFYWNYLAFMNNLRVKYPNAKFVLCHGMMDNAGGELAFALDDLCHTAANYGFTNPVMRVDLTAGAGPFMGGGGNHPNAAQHATASENLLAALRNAGWVS